MEEPNVSLTRGPDPTLGALVNQVEEDIATVKGQRP